MRESRLVQTSSSPSAISPAGGAERVVSFRVRHELEMLQKAINTRDDESHLLHALMDEIPDYLWVKDRGGRFILANKALANDAGVASGKDLIGKTDFDLHTAERAKAFFGDEQAIIRSGQPMIDHEEYVVDCKGRGKWLSTTKLPVRDPNDQITGLVGISRDITERKRAEQVCIDQARILEMIAVRSPLTDVLDASVRTIESQIDTVCAAFLLFDRDKVRLRHGAAPNVPTGLRQALDGASIGANAVTPGGIAFLQRAVIVKDVHLDPLWADCRAPGQPLEFSQCWLVPIHSKSTTLLGVVAVYSREARRPSANELAIVDAAARLAGIAIERQVDEARIRFLAHHDALTGLPNRNLLMDRLTQAILRAQRDAAAVTVAFIDLDNFKLINDRFGHDAGDELIKLTAQRITGCLRAGDTVVRFGGDEFVIVLPDQPALAQAACAALHAKIFAAIGEKVSRDGVEYHVTCSMGIARYPVDGEDGGALLKHADSAMYAAKNMGRNNVQYYTKSMSADITGHLTLHEEMRRAIAHGNFRLVYQPQVDMRSGRIFGVEALVRWDHPTRGSIAPADFIPMAEETGLIVSIGDWVLRAACLQSKAWQDEGLPPVTMCVSVSARQFRDKGWAKKVGAALRDSGLDPHCLELEITESVLMQNDSEAIAKMHELAALGVRFAIDDFGTGYSNLNALKSYPITRLKIDRSFVGKLPDNDNDKAIATALIWLGQRMNMRVIAEGVETRQQYDFLQENNCDEMQGYLFSEPLGAEGITRIFAHSHDGPAV